MRWRLAPWLVLILAASGIAALNKDEPAVVLTGAINLWNEVKKDFKLPTNNENVVVVFGTPESKKSSLIRHVAGDHSDKTIESESVDVPVAVPKFFIDEDNVAWYDFPDFTDMKNLSVDIVRSNFLKKIVEHAENTKFVLVVNKASLNKQAANHADYEKSLKLPVQLYKNVEADKISIALIVSEVDPSASEHEVIDSVVEFLNAYKNTLQPSETASKFLNAPQTTLKDGIGIYRQTVSTASDQKQSLRKLVKENSKSLNAVDTPFDYHLSKEMEDDISALTGVIKRNISESIKLIGDAVDKFYNIDLTDDNKILLNRTQHALSELANQEDKFKEREFLISLKNLVQVQGIYIDSDEFENIANQQKFLNFLDVATSNEIQVPSSAETFTLQHSILHKFETNDGELAFWSDLAHEKTKNEKDWTDFKRKLFDELMRYKYQSNRQLYNVDDISNWGKPKSGQGIHITKNNLKQFLDLFTFAKSLSDDIWTDKRVRELNNIVFSCLKPISKDCQEGNITLAGEFFTSSDINPCKNSASNINVTIFALDTFVIDKSLNLFNVTQMSIFSYQWFIKSGSEIALNGHSPSSGKGMWDRFKDWAGWGSNDRKGTQVHPAGEDGSAGRPAGNGGNFFGLMREISSNNALSLRSAGGNGGKGEDGAEAYPAKVRIKSGWGSGSSCSNDGRREIDDVGNLAQKKEQGKTVEGKNNYGTFGDIYAQTIYTTGYRLWGGCCARDGLAGRGGEGGVAGKMVINTLGENKGEFRQRVTNGTTGSNGKNIVPCKALIQHVTYKKTVTENTKGFPYPQKSTSINCDWRPGSTEENTECTRVNKYTDYSDKGVKQPAPLTPLDLETLINYKMFLIDNINHDEQIRNLREFYDEIDTNLNSTQIIGLYTVPTLIKSLKSLEERFFLRKDDFNFLSSYRNLLARIDSYSKLRENSTSQSERKVLTWLYATTLSKVYSLEGERDSALITDIKNYLPIVEKNIQVLEESERKKIVQDNTRKYRNEVDAKINEANNFIQNKVLPSFDGYYKMIDGQMEKFINEILDNKKKTKEEIKELEKKQELLRQNLEARKALGILNTIGTLIGFAGPYGQGAQAIIKTGTTIGGSFIVDPKDVPKKTITIPPDVSKFLDSMDGVVQAKKKQKIDAIKTELDNLKKKIKDEVDPVTKEQIDALVADLEKEKSSPEADTKKVDSLNKKCIDLIDRRKKELDDKKDTKLSKTFQYAGKALKIIDGAFEVYNQVQNDEKKIDAVSEEIGKAEKTYQKYQKLEKEAFDTLVPMLSMIRDDLKNIQNGLTAQTHAALDMARWDVQGKLRTTRAVVAKFVEGYNVESSIAESFQKLDDAFTLLINLYDRIQSYQDQEKLVSYIGSVVSTGFDNIRVEDPGLESDVIDLRQILAANIVLSQYLRAVNAFKQVVFPFAGAYLSNYVLPPHLQPEKSLSALIDAAVYRINSLNEVVKSNSSEVNIHDRYIYSGRFDSTNPALRPFFVWHREEYGKYIDDFLSGEKVYLRADITRGIDLNAVKFNKIGVEFYSDNEDVTKDLRLALNSSFITLTHSGVSFYQCDNKFYKITHDVLDINYSYLKKANGDPEVPNGVYEKLERGNMAVSPYTLWGLQIEGGKNVDLSAFKGLIDLELYGFGQYVRPNNEACHTNLEQFYEFDPNVFEYGHISEYDPRVF